MAIDPDYLLNIAPEMKKEAPERRQFFIDRAYERLNAPTFGPKLDYAAGLYACHLITVFNRRGNAQTSQEKVGDLQREYAVPKNADDAKFFLASTAYGMELWNLIKSRVITPYIAGDGGNSNPGGFGGGFGFCGPT